MPDTLHGAPGCADRQPILSSRFHTPATSRHPLPVRPCFHFKVKKLSRSRSTVRWWSKAVNRSCFLSFAAFRTPFNPRHAPSRSVSGACEMERCSPRSACPSLPNLRRRLPLFVRLVHRYYGTVRLLLYVHVRRSVYGLRGPVLLFDQDVQEISRFSCMLFLSVRGFLDCLGPINPLAFNVVVVLPSSHLHRVGALNHRHSAQ